MRANVTPKQRDVASGSIHSTVVITASHWIFPMRKITMTEMETGLLFCKRIYSINMRFIRSDVHGVSIH